MYDGLIIWAVSLLMAWGLGRRSGRKAGLSAARLEWERLAEPVPVADDSWTPPGSILRSGRRGEILKFEYADLYGEVTIRSVTTWTEYEEYFSGHCSLRKAERSFRKDRVIAWMEGEHLLAAPYEPAPQRGRKRARSSGAA